ncbi:retrovirus-related pol polyprotein from transposon TNT 1-94 [Tanacetum coccineum]
MEDPGLFTLPCRLGDSKPFDTLADLGSCVNIIPLYLFKKLNIRLLEETDHIFGLADITKSYPVGIVKDVEVHIGKLKLLNDFYVIDIKKDPETPLLVGRGFLATANTVIDCRMAKIAVIFDEKQLESRKAHLLEDKQIPSVGVFDEVYSAFGGNTPDLGSFGEETDKTTDLHQHCSRISPQKLETTSQITRDAVTNPTTTASQDIATKSYDDRINDDEDNEDPPAGPNQGKKTKKRRTNESESPKKQSTTKETPKGKAPSKGSKTGKSGSAKEPVEEPIAEVVMEDAGEDVVHDADQPQDASKPKTDKTPEWFKQPPRPPTPDLKWNKRQVVLDQPEQPWFNEMVSAKKDPLTFNDLMAAPINFPSTCSSSIELEYHFQECFNAMTDRLDWNNPEGDRYPFDMSKPFPLQGHPGHLTVDVDYLFNNDLEYLKSSYPERTYTTSITKTKAARVKGSVSVQKLHGYGYLEEIVVKRVDRQFYKFKEGDFIDLHMNDNEDILLLAVQHKLFHLTDSDIVDFIVALQIYQKKLNLTPPQQIVLEIEFKEPYTPSHKPPSIIYVDLTNQKRVMRADELYKFSDEMLKKVQDKLHHRIRGFRLE